MATVTARKVDDRDYAALSEMAEEHGRSISDELRCLIAEHARKRRVAQLIAEMNEIRAAAKPLPDGRTMQDLLREERNSW